MEQQRERGAAMPMLLAAWPHRLRRSRSRVPAVQSRSRSEAGRKADVSLLCAANGLDRYETDLEDCQSDTEEDRTLSPWPTSLTHVIPDRCGP